MVYVYSKLSTLNKYIGKKLTTEEIKETLIELGMDIKGESGEKNNPELKIEITAEKMDLISTCGIARAIKSYIGLNKNLIDYEIKPSNLKVIVDKNVKKVRPKTVAVILKDVPMNEEFLNEIIEIQEKIHSSFGRQRKKAAIGIYPLEKIKFPIFYKALNPNEIKFQTLESEKELTGNEILTKTDTGKKYAHLLENQKQYPIFIDSNNSILSMPPIINSKQTGKVEPHHKSLFIECSGHNLKHLDNILKTLVTTFIDMGATAQSVEVIYEEETYKLDLAYQTFEIDYKYINKLIGFNLSKEEIISHLPKVQFEFEENKKDILKIKVPCFRTDIYNDCDIADDIARAYGYNNIQAKFPNISSIGEENDFSYFKNQISKTLINLGFIELYTYMLASTKNQFDNFLRNETEEKYLKIENSANEGLNMLRTLILPENLSSMTINRKNKYPQKIFENGFTLQVDLTKDTKAVNQSHLSVSIADPKSNFTQIKEIFDTINKMYKLNLSLIESKYPYLIEGRQAEILNLKKEKVGFIGEIHPHVLENFDLLVPVSSFEIFLDKIHKE